MLYFFISLFSPSSLTVSITAPQDPTSDTLTCLMPRPHVSSCSFLHLFLALYLIHKFIVSGFYSFLILFSYHRSSAQSRSQEPGNDLTRRCEVGGREGRKKGSKVYAYNFAFLPFLISVGLCQEGRHFYCTSQRGFASVLTPLLSFLLPTNQDSPKTSEDTPYGVLTMFHFADQGAKTLYHTDLISPSSGVSVSSKMAENCTHVVSFTGAFSH